MPRCHLCSNQGCLNMMSEERACDFKPTNRLDPGGDGEFFFQSLLSIERRQHTAVWAETFDSKWSAARRDFSKARRAILANIRQSATQEEKEYADVFFGIVREIMAELDKVRKRWSEPLDKMKHDIALLYQCEPLTWDSTPQRQQYCASDILRARLPPKTAMPAQFTSCAGVVHFQVTNQVRRFLRH